MADTPSVYGFPITDAKTLAAIARSHALEAKQVVGGVADLPITNKYLSYLAKTGATAITARVGTTPGTGLVTLQVYDKYSNEIIDYKHMGRVITKTVLSFAPTASGVNAYIWVGFDTFGTLWYLNEACEV
jgi:hypothetical protein